MSTTRTAAAAALLAAATALATAPTAHAADPVVRPGTVIKQTAGDKISTCTVALVGRDTNVKIAITAGHCKISDGPVTLDDGKTTIGTYRVASPENRDKLADDASGFGIINLTSKVATTSATRYGNMTGYRTAKTGDQVCLLGATSGRACGAVTTATDKALSVGITAKPGDSGGPVIQYLDGPRDSTGAYINFALVGVTVGTHDTVTVANPIVNAMTSVSSAIGAGWTYTATT